MKKITIESSGDVEILYQGFKKKMLKDFENGNDTTGQADIAIKWIMKKAGLSKLAAVNYVEQFLNQIATELEAIEKVAKGKE